VHALKTTGRGERAKTRTQTSSTHRTLRPPRQRPAGGWPRPCGARPRSGPHPRSARALPDRRAATTSTCSRVAHCPQVLACLGECARQVSSNSLVSSRQTATFRSPRSVARGLATRGDPLRRLVDHARVRRRRDLGETLGALGPFSAGASNLQRAVRARRPREHSPQPMVRNCRDLWPAAIAARSGARRVGQSGCRHR